MVKSVVRDGRQEKKDDIKLRGICRMVAVCRKKSRTRERASQPAILSGPAFPLNAHPPMNGTHYITEFWKRQEVSGGF